jgi:hypothetical protein
VAGASGLRTSGRSAYAEEDDPAERRDDGEDEKPFDHGDGQNDPEHDQRCQQEQ